MEVRESFSLKSKSSESAKGTRGGGAENPRAATTKKNQGTQSTKSQPSKGGGDRGRPDRA
jgi:hypothetical protein